MTHGSVLIKKKSIDELGGYNHVKGMEDWDLWKRDMNKGVFVSPFTTTVVVANAAD